MAWSRISVTSRKISKQSLQFCVSFTIGLIEICQKELLPQIIVAVRISSTGISFVWITEIALVTRIHSHPRRDLDRFNYCIRTARQTLWHHIKLDVPFAPTNFCYLPLYGGLASYLAPTMFDPKFNLK